VLKLLRTPFDGVLRPLASYPRSRPSAEPGPGPALTPETGPGDSIAAIYQVASHTSARSIPAMS
jgi:hypothetical protein